MSPERAPSTLLTKFLNKDFFRFLLVGGVNTCITYGLYLILLLTLPYSVSFTISYVVGLIFVSVMNVKVVFHKEITVINSLKTIGVYLLQYVLSMVLLVVFIQNLSVSPKIAPLIIIVLLVPATFIGNRFLLQEPPMENHRLK
jgi:putative flippase GtrA